MQPYSCILAVYVCFMNLISFFSLRTVHRALARPALATNHHATLYAAISKLLPPDELLECVLQMVQFAFLINVLRRHVSQMTDMGTILDLPQATAVLRGLARARDFASCVGILDSLAARHVSLDATAFNLTLQARLDGFFVIVSLTSSNRVFRARVTCKRLKNCCDVS